jgi:myo-inositol-1(or 4)-monophosphatase
MVAPVGDGPLDAVLLAELGALAERAARSAGDLVRDQRPDALGVASTKSSPTDVVTAMDLAAEELITAVLREARPEDGLLGEEGGLRTGTSGLTWVVDPIDGTVNYLYGLPAYAVSVAVVAGDPRPPSWRVLAGCVHNPASGETWTAVEGGGSFCDGARLGPVSAPPLPGALVATGFSYLASRRAEQAEVLAALLPRVRDVRRTGSAALDLCAVASGRVDAYYERGVNPWDVAAGWRGVSEAGGELQEVLPEEPEVEPGRPAASTLVAAARPLAGQLARELAVFQRAQQVGRRTVEQAAQDAGATGD